MMYASPVVVILDTKEFNPLLIFQAVDYVIPYAFRRLEETRSTAKNPVQVGIESKVDSREGPRFAEF